MRYDAEKNRITVSCRELVRSARRGICATLPYDEDEPSIQGDGQITSTLYYEFNIDEYAFTLVADTCAVCDGAVSLSVPVDSSPRRPRKEVTAQARGEGYITAFILSESTGDASIEIRYSYLNRQTGEKNEVSETVTRKKLVQFFRCDIFHHILFPLC